MTSPAAFATLRNEFLLSDSCGSRSVLIDGLLKFWVELLLLLLLVVVIIVVRANMVLAFGLGSIEWTHFNSLSLVSLLLMIITVIGYWIERLRNRRMDPVLAELAAKETNMPLLSAKAPLPTSKRRDDLIDFVRTACLCCWMVLCSVSIIYINAWILDNLCPHAATLTAIQQAFGACAAYICVYALGLTEPVDGVSVSVYVTYIIPLAAAFTVYLWGSNAAYIYLAPGFIQMVKPLGSAIVFVVATSLGLERYTHAKFGNFLLICSGIALTAISKFDGQLAADVDESPATRRQRLTKGLCVLVGAYVVVAFFNTGLQIIQRKGVVAVKFNPLTSLLYIAPAASCFLTAYAAVTEWSSPHFSCFDKLPWWVMLIDCVVAFVFNLSMMLFIGRLSAVAYSLFAFFKEIILVVIAFCFFEETVTRGQLEGYAVTTLAVLVWQHRKLYSIA